MKLWLDDVRPPWKHGYTGYEWVKTAEDAMRLLQTRRVICMKSLILGDIHNRVERAERIIQEHYREVDQIVLLGDYFDDFNDCALDAIRTAQWIRSHHKDPKFVWLLGNHDLPYLFDAKAEPYLDCPGYTASKRQAIDRYCLGDIMPLRRMKVFHQVGEWMLTHAGITPRFEVYAKNWRESNESFIFSPGYRCTLSQRSASRGGQYKNAGPLWADFNGDLVPTHGLKQLVGHTAGLEVRSKGSSDSAIWCIDTNLRHYAILDNNELRIF